MWPTGDGEWYSAFRACRGVRQHGYGMVLVHEKNGVVIFINNMVVAMFVMAMDNQQLQVLEKVNMQIDMILENKTPEVRMNLFSRFSLFGYFFSELYELSLSLSFYKPSVSTLSSYFLLCPYSLFIF